MIKVRNHLRLVAPTDDPLAVARRRLAGLKIDIVAPRVARNDPIERPRLSADTARRILAVHIKEATT